MELENLLFGPAQTAALLIGNGIHRHGSSPRNSWERLLARTARRQGLEISQVPEGTSATEFFDVLELRARSKSGELASSFCELMRDWRPQAHHRAIMSWARRHDAPVLTTNFDEVLSDASGSSFHRPTRKGFTDFYPWECRFSGRHFEDPCSGFAIWHVNGMARYPRSIRLGLTHYMGSVQRVRGWIHHGDDALFGGKNRANWQGRRSWLHIVFNMPLIILGLGLQENEVFLRWLLIERARYFARFPARRHDAWFIHRHDLEDRGQAGKAFFLEEVGIKCLQVNSYGEIYENPAWTNS